MGAAAGCTWDRSSQEAPSAAHPATEEGAAHPVDPLENRDGFEPLVIEEEGGSRIVTPFYSVLVPAGMFPDGFTYTYSPSMPAGVWGEGLYRGYDLEVTPNGGNSPSIHAYVSSNNWDGVQGEMAALSAGSVAGNADFHVVVDGPADYTADPSGQQTRDALAPICQLVSTDIVAVPGENDGWSIVDISQKNSNH